MKLPAKLALLAIVALIGGYIYWTFLLGFFRDDIDIEAAQEQAEQAEQNAQRSPFYGREEAEAILATFDEIFVPYYDPYFPDQSESEFRVLCPQIEDWLKEIEPAIREYFCSVTRSDAAGIATGNDQVVGYGLSLSGVLPSRKSASDMIVEFENFPTMVVTSISVDDHSSSEAAETTPQNPECVTATPAEDEPGLVTGNEDDNGEQPTPGEPEGDLTEQEPDDTPDFADPLTTLDTFLDTQVVSPVLLLGWGPDCPTKLSLSLQLFAALPQEVDITESLN